MQLALSSRGEHSTHRPLVPLGNRARLLPMILIGTGLQGDVPVFPQYIPLAPLLSRRSHLSRRFRAANSAMPFALAGRQTASERSGVFADSLTRFWTPSLR